MKLWPYYRTDPRATCHGGFIKSYHEVSGLGFKGLRVTVRITVGEFQNTTLFFNNQAQKSSNFLG